MFRAVSFLMLFESTDAGPGFLELVLVTLFPGSYLTALSLLWRKTFFPSSFWTDILPFDGLMAGAFFERLIFPSFFTES